MADKHTAGRFALGVMLVVEGLVLFYVVLATLPLALEADRSNATAAAPPCATARGRVTPSPTAPTPSARPSTVATPTAVAASPDATPTATAASPRDLGLRAFDRCWSVSSDAALLLLVMVVGALGAFVHAATSFARHIAKRDFDDAYHWWYAVRVLVGAAVAAIFYFVIRGGLLSVAADTTAPNVYGITAVAALAGLFSYPAMKRLEALFERIGNGDDRAFQTAAAKPVIARVVPDRVAVGTAERTVTVEGTGFGATPGVRVGNERRDSDAVVTTAGIALTLRESDVASAGTLQLRVVADNRWSDSVTVVVE